ncbi:MAG: BTAD domain-containing putative transcriptional regulator [Bacillota bacterium]
MSRAFLLQEKWDESTFWADKAMEVYKNHGSTKGRLRLLTQEYQFFIYHPQQDMHQALRAFKAAREMWIKAGNRHEALMAEINMAMVFRVLGDYKKALESSWWALKEAESLMFEKGRAFVLFALAQIHRDLDNIPQAFELYNDTIFLAKQLEIVQLEAGAHHSISGLYRKQGNLEAALKHARIALDLAGKIDVSYFLGQASMNMGRVCWDLGDLKGAIAYFRQALEIFSRWQAQYEEARVSLYLAGTLSQQYQGAVDVNKCKIVYSEIANLVQRGIKLITSNDYEFFFKREKEYALPIIRWAIAQKIEEHYLSQILFKLGEEKQQYMLRVFTLGHFRVYLKDCLVPDGAWKSSKANGLFRFLLLNKGKKIERDILLETFWRDMDIKAAANNLSSCLYTLRRMFKDLGEPGLSNLIYYEKGLCWLGNDLNIWVDSEEFLIIVDQAKTELRKGNSKQAENLYRKAAEIYGGDYFEEYPYDDWLVPERERIREAWIQSQKNLANILEKENDFDGAAMVFKSILRKDPFREETYQRIIQCLLRAGRRVEAMEQYKRCKEVLYQEFGIDPSPETVKLIGHSL